MVFEKGGRVLKMISDFLKKRINVSALEDIERVGEKEDKARNAKIIV
jgi:hypothetical protein